MVRGSWRRTELQYIDPHSYDRQHCVFLVLQGCSTVSPEAQLSAECWLSLPHLVTSWSLKILGAPRASLAGSGFPYHILLETSLDPDTSGGPPGPLSVWGGFPYHTRLQLQLSDFLSWLSYIIVQRLLNRPLNLWNGMFDRHQAEITHAVHRSLSSGESLCSGTVGPSPCPILSAELTCAISFD